MTRRTLLSAAAAAAALLAGCAHLEPPRVLLQRIERPRLGVGSASLRVVFQVHNPNDEDLLVERLRYDLFLNGERVGEGFLGEPVSLRAYERERVVSRVDIDLLRLPGAVRRVLRQDEVRARVSGAFHVRKRGGGHERIGFDAGATIDLEHERE